MMVVVERPPGWGWGWSGAAGTPGPRCLGLGGSRCRPWAGAAGGDSGSPRPAAAPHVLRHPSAAPRPSCPAGPCWVPCPGPFLPWRGEWAGRLGRRMSEWGAGDRCRLGQWVSSPGLLTRSTDDFVLRRVRGEDGQSVCIQYGCCKCQTLFIDSVPYILCLRLSHRNMQLSSDSYRLYLIFMVTTTDYI